MLRLGTERDVLRARASTNPELKRDLWCGGQACYQSPLQGVISILRACIFSSFKSWRQSGDLVWQGFVSDQNHVWVNECVLGGCIDKTGECIY